MVQKRRSTRKSKPVKVYVDSSENVVESLVFTRGQTGGNIYRQRFLLRLMELAQSQVKANLPAVHGHSKIFFDTSFEPVVEIPVNSIITDGSGSDYIRAKKAILDFASWVFVYEDAKRFVVVPVLIRSELDKVSSVFQFKLDRHVWESMFNFTKGFSVYNLKVALSIENELALKIYKGLAKQNGEMFYTFEAFRKAYGFTKRYVGRDHDLVKCMIEPAKAELDEKSPWTFEYTLSYGYKNGNTRGRKSLLGISIIPVHILGREGMDGIRKRIHPSELIGREVWNILTQKLYFTFAEVKANVHLFEIASKNLGEAGFADWLNALVPKAVRADSSTQGYVINSVKQFLRKKFGIVYGAKDAPGVSEVVGDIVEDPSEQDGPAVVVSPSVDAGDDDQSLFRENVVKMLTEPGTKGRAAGSDVVCLGDLFGQEL